jgi:hypothetical protein
MSSVKIWDCNRFDVSYVWLFNSGGRMVLPLRPESEVTSEQESRAKDGDLFSAERSQLKVKTE